MRRIERKAWLLPIACFLLPVVSNSSNELLANDESSSKTSVEVQAKTITLKGVVLEASNGEPIPMATIRIKNQNKGTNTNLDGEFSLECKVGDVLVISFVGLEEQEFTVKNAGPVTIKLKESAEMLETVVVTGMVAQDKRLFTGATDKLDAKDVKLDGVADLSRGLEGRSAGVTVQNVSGTFGTAPKIRVRGATSIYGDSKPLWVVDGVIQENVVEVSADALSSGDATTLISSAIAGLNPDDIESFQILKDGSATSIYGAKAMAGVIVITTKKGKSGTSSFSYTGEFTSRLIPSYNEFNIMNSQDQMGFYEELRQKGWLTFAETFRSSTSGEYGRMYQLTHQYNPTTGQWGLPNTPEARADYLRAAEMRNTDWFAELFSPAVMMNHSISMSSGTEKNQTYVSLSVMTDPGWMVASNVNRYTANLNNTYHFSDKVNINAIANVSYRKQKAPGSLSQGTDAVNGTVSRDFDINPYSYALNTSRTLDPNVAYTRNYAPFNIHKELENNYMDLDVFDAKFQGEISYKPIQSLTFKALGAFKYSGTKQEHKIKDGSNQALAYRAMGDATIIDRNPWLYTDPDKPNSLPFSILPNGGFYNINNYKMYSYDFRLSGQYNTVFGESHIFNTYAGMELNAQDRSSDGFDGWGMQYSNGEVPFWEYNAFKHMKEGNSDYYYLYNTRVRTLAFFATATYSYQGKYTLTATGRYEGSNRLGKTRKARWLPTWNVAAAWNAHEEDFFRDHLSDVLSNLTLKASYSLTADAGPRWVTNSRVIIGSYNPWRPSASVTESGLEVRNLENSGLTYEKKHELNVGADVGFLHNRINLAVDWYKRNNFDLIGYTNTQGVGGEVNRIGNVASMKSHGLEVSLSTQNIKTKNFGWTTSFIFGYNSNEVTKLDNRSRVIDFITGTGFAREGYPVRGLFSIPFDGLDEEGFPVFNINGNKITKDNYGSINFQDRENIDYLKYEGPIDPTINGSLGNIFTYRGFRLNVFITYSGGNKLRLNPVFRSWYSDLDATPKDFQDRWMVPGDEKITNIPKVLSQLDVYYNGNSDRGYNAYNYSTARVAKGDFVRLKELSLSYDVPRDFLESRLNYLKSASVKLQATNLLLIYADPELRGQDPEFFQSGGVSAPVPKQVTATLRLGF